jgi:hypothetical protein
MTMLTLLAFRNRPFGLGGLVWRSPWPSAETTGAGKVPSTSHGGEIIATLDDADQLAPFSLLIGNLGCPAKGGLRCEHSTAPFRFRRLFSQVWYTREMVYRIAEEARTRRKAVKSPPSYASHCPSSVLPLLAQAQVEVEVEVGKCHSRVSPPLAA